MVQSDKERVMRVSLETKTCPRPRCDQVSRSTLKSKHFSSVFICITVLVLASHSHSHSLSLFLTYSFVHAHDTNIKSNKVTKWLACLDQLRHLSSRWFSCHREICPHRRAFCIHALVSACHAHCAICFLIFPSLLPRMNTFRRDKTMSPGEIGTSALHRSWALLSLNQRVSVQVYDTFNPQHIVMTRLVLQIDFLKKSHVNTTPYNTDDMSRIFQSCYQDQVFTLGQSLAFEFQGVHLLSTIYDLETQAPVLGSGQDKKSQRGILVSNTTISFMKVPDSAMKLTGSVTR